MNVKYAKTGSIEDRLLEELGELIQAVCKARRFGYNGQHPGTGIGNQQAITSEIADVRSLLDEYSDWLEHQ